MKGALLLIVLFTYLPADGQLLRDVMDDYFLTMGGKEAILAAKSSKELSLNWYRKNDRDKPDHSNSVRAMTILKESRLKKFISFDSKGAIENEFYYTPKETVLGMGSFIQHLERKAIPPSSMANQLLELYNSDKLESDGEKQLNSTSYNVVKTKNTDEIQFYYFNKTTKLLELSQSAGSDRLTSYKNYKNTNLILHPFLTEEIQGGILYYQQITETFEFNPVIDDAIFYFNEASYYQDIEPKMKFQSIVVEPRKSNLPDLINTNFPGLRALIDMWATWCSPCLKEFRSYDSAFYQFMDERLIKMVYLSIDKDSDKQKWRKEIDRLALKGYHVRADQELLNSIQKIVFSGGRISIPRYILVDEQSRIRSINFIRASDPNFKKAIDSTFLSR